MSFKTFNRYLICTLLQGLSQEKYTFLCRIYLPLGLTISFCLKMKTYASSPEEPQGRSQLTYSVLTLINVTHFAG